MFSTTIDDLSAITDTEYEYSGSITLSTLFFGMKIKAADSCEKIERILELH
jgi:hypothetical protein